MTKEESRTIELAEAYLDAKGRKKNAGVKEKAAQDALLARMDELKKSEINVNGYVISRNDLCRISVAKLKDDESDDTPEDDPEKVE